MTRICATQVVSAITRVGRLDRSFENVGGLVLDAVAERERNDRSPQRGRQGYLAKLLVGRLFTDLSQRFRCVLRIADHFFAPAKMVGLVPVSAASKCSKVRQQMVYSITSSACATSVAGTEKPSALAVLRLIAVSNLTGAWTGSSAGFAPLRMRST